MQQPQQPFQNNSFFPPANVPGIPLAIPNQAGVTTGYPQFQIPPVSAPQQPPPASGFDARIYQNSNTYQSVQQNKITPNHILPPQNPFNTAPPPQFPQQTVTPPTLNPLAPASAPPPAPTPGGGLDILDIGENIYNFTLWHIYSFDHDVMIVLKFSFKISPSLNSKYGTNVFKPTTTG